MQLLEEIRGQWGESEGWISDRGEDSGLWLKESHSGTWSESLRGSPFTKLLTKIVYHSSLKEMWPQVCREP